MPRCPRPNCIDIPLHVIQRGVNRNACFRDERDYRLYLGLLEELAPRFDCEIHAHALMTNHVHLLLTPRALRGCSHLMRHVGQRFVQAINRRWPRTGPLWEGRFKACLVDSAPYGLTCQRYIELNPVRAGMVRHPAEYRWSSYRNNAYGTPSALLRPLDVYHRLGNDDESRRLAYRSLFDQELSDQELWDIREAIRTGRPLGPKEFIDRVWTLAGMAMRRQMPQTGDGRRVRLITEGSCPGVTGEQLVLLKDPSPV